MRSLERQKSRSVSSRTIGTLMPLALVGALAGFSDRAIAENWIDGGDIDTATGTALNSEGTIYGFSGKPSVTKCILTVDDGVGGSQNLVSTDTTCTIFSEIDSVLESYDPTLVGNLVDVSGNRSSTGEFMFWNYDGGYAFTVEGLESGAVTSWSDLDGTPSYIGSIDESTGRYFITGHNSSSGTTDISELSKTSSAISVHDDSSKNEAAIQVDLTNDRGFISDFASSYDIHQVVDLTTSSAAMSSLGHYGIPVQYIAADQSWNTYDTIIVLDPTSRTLSYLYDEDSGVTYEDADGDTYTSDVDCDDSDASIYPGADEYCDGVDNDCDEVVDEDDAVDAGEWYLDSDADTYGADVSSALPVDACDQPSGYVENDWDCDDGDAGVNPNQEEYCDGIDNDCDDRVDEEDAVDAGTWWVDADGDTYGNVADSQVACDQPEGYVDNDEDCNDSDADLTTDCEDECVDVVEGESYGTGTTFCTEGYPQVLAGRVTWNGTEFVLESDSGISWTGGGDLRISSAPTNGVQIWAYDGSRGYYVLGDIDVTAALETSGYNNANEENPLSDTSNSDLIGHLHLDEGSALARGQYYDGDDLELDYEAVAGSGGGGQGSLVYDWQLADVVDAEYDTGGGWDTEVPGETGFDDTGDGDGDGGCGEGCSSGAAIPSGWALGGLGLAAAMAWARRREEEAA
jgi:hypothetical protein